MSEFMGFIINSLHTLKSQIFPFYKAQCFAVCMLWSLMDHCTPIVMALDVFWLDTQESNQQVKHLNVQHGVVR